MISLFGVACGFLVHMLAAAIGLTALFMAVPLAHEVLKWLGAAYLSYLAWQSFKPIAIVQLEATQAITAAVASFAASSMPMVVNEFASTVAAVDGNGCH